MLPAEMGSDTGFRHHDSWRQRKGFQAARTVYSARDGDLRNAEVHQRVGMGLPTRHKEWTCGRINAEEATPELDHGGKNQALRHLRLPAHEDNSMGESVTATCRAKAR